MLAEAALISPRRSGELCSVVPVISDLLVTLMTSHHSKVIQVITSSIDPQSGVGIRLAARVLCNSPKFFCFVSTCLVEQHVHRPRDHEHHLWYVRIARRLKGEMTGNYDVDFDASITKSMTVTRTTLELCT